MPKEEATGFTYLALKKKKKKQEEKAEVKGREGKEGSQMKGKNGELRRKSREKKVWLQRRRDKFSSLAVGTSKGMPVMTAETPLTALSPLSMETAALFLTKVIRKSCLDITIWCSLVWFQPEQHLGRDLRAACHSVAS